MGHCEAGPALCSPGDGKLIVLRLSPVAMLRDQSRELGKATVRQFAARTVLADGRPLPEANPRLKQAPAAKGTA